MNTNTNTSNINATKNAIVDQPNENVSTKAKSGTTTKSKAAQALTDQRKRARSTKDNASTKQQKPVEAKQPVERQPRAVKSISKQQRDLLTAITKEVNKAPRGSKLSTLHILTIKHSEEIKDISAKQFCEITKLPKAYGIEFIRIGGISDRLQSCGLDIQKL